MNLTDEERHVHCRSLGHRWEVTSQAKGDDIVEPPKKLSVGGITELMMRCDMCTTSRFDYVSRGGRIVRRKYVYPDGYLHKKGEERPPRADYRMRLLSIGIGRLKRMS